MDIYTLLKKRINRKTYKSKEDIQEMVDVFYYFNKLTTEQYEELVELLIEE